MDLTKSKRVATPETAQLSEDFSSWETGLHQALTVFGKLHEALTLN
jgi:hypothetical protein